MPTSNGQVTSRDIRQAAVKTLHIVDDAVATAKIPDLAVTFPDKIDDPIWVYATQGDPWSGGTLSTTRTQFGEFTVAIPAWVDQVAAFVTCDIQVTNDTGATRLFSIQATIDDQVFDTNQASIANNEIGSVYHTQVTNLADVAGSSIEFAATAFVSAGSTTSHNGNVRVMLVGER